MDYDPLVVKLNKDISAIEEAMGAALQQHKFQYIFEGQHRPGVKYKQLPEKYHSPAFLKQLILFLFFLFSLFSPTRSGSSDLLYSNQRGPVL